jgi:hypothetical protein
MPISRWFKGKEANYFFSLAPLLIFVFFIAIYPLAFSFFISFFKYRLTDPNQTRTFVGLANYIAAFKDPQVLKAISNTLVFVAGTVIIEMTFGLALALLFGSHLVLRLAEWQGVALFAVGLGLLILEIVAIPGFGLVGIAGIVLMLASLVITQLGDIHLWSMDEVAAVVGRLAGSMIAAIVASLVFLRALPRFALFNRLILRSATRAEDGFVVGGVAVAAPFPVLSGGKVHQAVAHQLAQPVLRRGRFQLPHGGGGAEVERGGEEGEQARWERITKCWEEIHKGIEEIGLKSVIDKNIQGHLVVTVKAPEDEKFDFFKLHDYCYERGFTIYPGKMFGLKTFRLCNLGQITYKDIKNFFVVAKEAFKEMGYTLPLK